MDYLNLIFSEKTRPVKENISYFNKSLALGIGEFFARDSMSFTRRPFLATRDFFEILRLDTLAFNTRFRMAFYNFKIIMSGEESLEISEVKVAEVGKDMVVITWHTNHYSTSKINYGKTLTYGEDILQGDRVLDHRIAITNLEYETTYYFEVISHNGTTAYDAYHIFNTLPQ